jgi:putative peptidoglycan lipid II flippase
LPLGLVATALSFATLPVLARYGVSGAREPGFQRTLGTGLKAALLLITPAMVALIALRLPVIRLLCQRGAFHEEGAQLTSQALLFYAPQLPFVAVDQLLIAAFYALQNTRTPVLIGIVSAGVYATVALGTVERLGMPGLVLANTVQNGAHGVILLALLWRAAGGLAGQRLLAAALRIATAAVVMAAILAVWQMAVPVPEGALRLAAYVGIAGAIAGAAYVGVLLALRSEELVYVTGLLAERLRRRPPLVQGGAA